MKRKYPVLLITLICFGLTSCKKTENAEEKISATSEPAKEAHPAEEEKPTQHLKLPDVTSREEAVTVMKSTTDQLNSKQKLDQAELQQIHIITYSLEKAIEYFCENSSGDQKVTAQKMAEVVEEVHLNSENNRMEQTKKALSEYYQLADAFSNGL